MAAKAALVTVNMEVGLDYWLPWDTLVPQSGKERAAQNHTTKNEAVRPTCVLYIPWFFRTQDHFLADQNQLAVIMIDRMSFCLVSAIFVGQNVGRDVL